VGFSLSRGSFANSINKKWEKENEVKSLVKSVDCPAKRGSFDPHLYENFPLYFAGRKLFLSRIGIEANDLGW